MVACIFTDCFPNALSVRCSCWTSTSLLFLDIWSQVFHDTPLPHITSFNFNISSTWLSLNTYLRHHVSFLGWLRLILVERYSFRTWLEIWNVSAWWSYCSCSSSASTWTSFSAHTACPSADGSRSPYLQHKIQFKMTKKSHIISFCMSCTIVSITYQSLLPSQALCTV